MDKASGTPDDFATLLAEKNERICMCEEEIKAQALMIQKLKHQLAGHRQHRFGQKSEGLDQLGLQLAEDEGIAAALASDETDDVPSVDEKATPKRKALPANLPRREEVLSPGDICSCGVLCVPSRRM